MVAKKQATYKTLLFFGKNRARSFLLAHIISYFGDNMNIKVNPELIGAKFCTSIDDAEKVTDILKSLFSRLIEHQKTATGCVEIRSYVDKTTWILARRGHEWILTTEEKE